MQFANRVRYQQRNPGENITFESLRKILSEPASVEQEAREERRHKIIESFRNEAFPDLVAKAERKVSEGSDSKIENIL